MNYLVSRFDDVAVLQLIPQRFDRILVPEFKLEMNKIIETDCLKIVLDISEVEYIDSSALGAIVNFSQKLNNKGQIVIAGIKEPVMQLFKLTRLNKIFRFYTSAFIAVESFKSVS